MAEQFMPTFDKSIINQSHPTVYWTLNVFNNIKYDWGKREPLQYFSCNLDNHNGKCFSLICKIQWHVYIWNCPKPNFTLYQVHNHWEFITEVFWASEESVEKVGTILSFFTNPFAILFTGISREASQCPLWWSAYLAWHNSKKSKTRCGVC